MILLLFTRNYLFGQVIQVCSRQSDCYIGYYCDATSMCYDCSYVNPASCDSIDQDCCSTEFKRQCVANPHQCETPNPISPGGTEGTEDDMNPSLKAFLMVFSIGSISYLLVGSYWNHRVKNHSGYDIIPNKRFWMEFRSLVRDGVSFSHRALRGRLGYDEIQGGLE